jgi:hypothetical protein
LIATHCAFSLPATTPSTILQLRDGDRRARRHPTALSQPPRLFRRE